MRILGGPGRSVDVTERSALIGIVSICGGAALIFGAVLGFFFYGWHPLRGALLMGVPMGLASSALAYFIVDRAGAAVTGLHAPGGGTPIRGAPLSHPEALVAAGRFEDAVAALTEAAEAYPDDPTPAFMLAELYRDNLRELEKAAAWFRKAAAVRGVSKETQREILRALDAIRAQRRPNDLA